MIWAMAIWGRVYYLNGLNKKHGIEHFKKEIIEVFDSCEDMMQAESIVVNEEFVSSKETYNLVEGGGRVDNPKEHDYYKSGDHANNARTAGKFARIRNQELKEKRIGDYLKNPTLCAQCHNPLPYEKKRNKFCSHSCSAICSNTGRLVSEAHRLKLSNTIKQKLSVV